jgi:hypothetical protein
VTDQTSDTAAAGTDRSIEPTRFDPVTDPRPHDAPWPAMTWPMAPGLALRGRLVQLTAVDPELVRDYHRGVLIKIHPRKPPGGRSTDPDDLPSEKTAYAMRDLDHLRRPAAADGPAIGAYADALLDTPLPWTKMRQVYALLGLVKRWGAPTVEAACARALETEVVSVPLIGRMIERATENQPAPTAPKAKPTGRQPRFARDPGHFATGKPSIPEAKPEQQALEVEGGVA